MFVFGGTVNNDSSVSNVRSSELFRFQFSRYPKCTLHDDFGLLLNSKQFCDVEFIVSDTEGKEIKILAHIAFVAARSEYLRSEIRKAIENREMKLYQQSQEDWSDQEKQENLSILQIRFKNCVNAEAFEIVLEYIYTDRIDPTKRKMDPLSNKFVLTVMNVYTLAVQFRMKKLENLCLKYLNSAINNSNVLVALQNANEFKLEFIKVNLLLYLKVLLIIFSFLGSLYEVYCQGK